ncbi:MAG: orotate phosphoribosyltransferase [Opitutia bacterium]|jgi:orotate phosphoribosyltransferase
MSSTDEEVLRIFRESKALLTGHFVLRSGLHSGHFFQCAQVCQHMDKVTRLIELLRPRLTPLRCETVLAPAMGGLVVGQEIARQLGVRFVFAEKENDRLVMRRNFTFRAGERVLVAEDVVTRGGRAQECLDILKASGAEAVGVASLVDRSGGQTKFSVPFVSLLELTFPTYAADAVPPELARLPATKPGS